MLLTTTLLGVVTFFLKKYFDKVDEISNDVHEIKATLTEFKVDLLYKEKRIEIIERRLEKVK
ncbi:MAG: hypothetical protein RLZZ196_968 [Bacteroidota bacterium]|jgi:hypothetical protein